MPTTDPPRFIFLFISLLSGSVSLTDHKKISIFKKVMSLRGVLRVSPWLLSQVINWNLVPYPRATLTVPLKTGLPNENVS